MSAQVRDRLPDGVGFEVDMRLEFWDPDKTKLEMAVARDGVRFQTIPTTGDLLGPGMIIGGVDTCPTVHHLEHYFAPSWHNIETGEPGAEGTIVVIRGRWPGDVAGKELVDAYSAHGWKQAMWRTP